MAVVLRESASLRADSGKLLVGVMSFVPPAAPRLLQYAAIHTRQGSCLDFRPAPRELTGLLKAENFAQEAYSC
jgi:hypothetical protein